MQFVTLCKQFLSSFKFSLSIICKLLFCSKIEKLKRKKVVELEPSYFYDEEVPNLQGHSSIPEGVELKTVQTKHADVFFQENLIKKSVRPVSDRYTKFTDFDIFEFSMEKDGRYHDIGIEGLCWISFKAQGQKIRVQCPKGTAVKECLSKFR
mgnify:CR=1 FL=1